jgi:diadenosine tetraphosphate (Ap4A) HIT family hydrolase
MFPGRPSNRHLTPPIGYRRRARAAAPVAVQSAAARVKRHAPGISEAPTGVPGKAVASRPRSTRRGIDHGTSGEDIVKSTGARFKGDSAMAVSGLPPYDEQNIFARILRGEIPCKKIFENDFALAFHDINPQAPFHVLIIPKGSYCSFADFSASASDAEIAGFVRAVGLVAKDLGLEAPGYRLLANTGEHSGQEVPHFHIHLFGGRPLGRMISVK